MMKRLVLFCLLVLPVTLYAQDPRAHLQRAQDNNWYLRAYQGASIVAEGRVRRVTASDATIGSTRVDYAGITALERRAISGSGGLGLSVAGAIIMGAAALPFGGLCEGCSSWQRLIPGIAGFAAGLALGGIVGELAQPGSRKWQPLWSALPVSADSLSCGDVLHIAEPNVQRTLTPIPELQQHNTGALTLIAPELQNASFESIKWLHIQRGNSERMETVAVQSTRKELQLEPLPPGTYRVFISLRGHQPTAVTTTVRVGYRDTVEIRINPRPDC